MTEIPEAAFQPLSKAIGCMTDKFHKFVGELNAIAPNYRWGYLCDVYHEHIKMWAEFRWKELGRPQGRDDEIWFWAEQHYRDTYTITAYEKYGEDKYGKRLLDIMEWEHLELTPAEVREIDNAIHGTGIWWDQEGYHKLLRDYPDCDPWKYAYRFRHEDAVGNHELRRAIKVAVGLK